jgi:hypothetical protein
MSIVVSCACGAKVRLPERAEGKLFRCPRCQAEFLATVNARVLAASRARAGDQGALCPICQSPLAANEAVLACPECDQVHHQECWQEIGGCSTYGCAQAPAVGKETPAAAPTAWGDTKRCPACGERIKSIALRCRYCGTDFHTVDPLAAADLRRGLRKSERLRQLQITVVVVFLLSLVGLLAPLMVIVSLALLLPRRKQLVQAGPFYLILGYSSIAVSLLYSLLMLAFWAF